MLLVKQMVKAAGAAGIQAHDLSVDDRVLHGQLTKDGSERRESQAVLIAGDQFTFTVLDVGERSEAVVFQFEDEIGMVERFCDEAEVHWANAGEHSSSLAFEIAKKI